jgi:hypothetical protein
VKAPNDVFDLLNAATGKPKTLADRPREHTRKPKPPTRWEQRLASEEASLEKWLTRLVRVANGIYTARTRIKRYRKYVAEGKE